VDGIDHAIGNEIPSKGARETASETKRVSLRRLLLLAQARCIFWVFASGCLSYELTHEPLSMGRAQFWAMFYVAALLWAAFSHLRLFTKEALFSPRFYLGRIAAAWIGVAAAALSVAGAFDFSGLFSGEWARWWLVIMLLMLLADRFATIAAARRWKAQDRFHQRVVILGAGANGRRLLEHLQRQDDFPTTLVGFVDDRRGGRLQDPGDLPLLGTTRELLPLIRANRVDLVIIALPLAAAERVRDLVKRLRAFPIDIFLAPDLAIFEFPACRTRDIAGMPLVHVLRRPISGWSYAVKRAEDVAIALVCLFLLGPLLLLSAVAIKLTSRGPVLFRQKRYGFNNSVIDVLKFRTMFLNASDQAGAAQAVRNDPRVTPVGRLLRRTSIDELPQLINVLKGEMSIVGPRPHALGTRAAGRLFEELVDEYAARHRVKPGMTGWAQVHGLRGETDTVDKLRLRVEFDLHYIENWSLGFDLAIIAKTLPALLSHLAY